NTEVVVVVVAAKAEAAVAQCIAVVTVTVSVAIGSLAPVSAVCPAQANTYRSTPIYSVVCVNMTVMKLKSILLIVTALLALATILIECQEISVRGGAPDDINSMSEALDALKYLEQLDNYYSKVARPRFGRSIKAANDAHNRPLVRALKVPAVHI
ncbi:hypothetical protein GZH46_01365, partial [Fragariocoptes setiger]